MKPFHLPAYCKQQKLGHRQLADLLGISESYACQLRLDRKPITLRIAMLLSKKLELPLESFFKGNKGKTNNHKQITCR